MANQNRLDYGALFADETVQYRFPESAKAGDEVTFRFRTLKDDCDRVLLLGRAVRSTMEKKFSRGRFDFYETTLTLDDEPLHYFFEVTKGDETWFYNKRGAMAGQAQNQSEYAFKIFPGFSVPDWAKGSVMYQIFVDRFRNGNPASDVLDREYMYTNGPVERVTDWNSLPEAYDVRRHYGGDLVGVCEKLDYLKNLGIETIYFNPLFVSPSNHKYDIQDYDYIDPHFVGFVDDDGDLLAEGVSENSQATRYINRVTDEKNLKNANEYFAHLSEEIHKRGMHLIMDGVFNHCGSFNKWMDHEHIYKEEKGYKAGAFTDENSPYHSYFTFENHSKWPDNERYVGWWGHSTLPKLDYEHSQELHDYIMKVAKKWISPPYNIDGWRLDVAADLGHTSEYNHQFWRDFRQAVKSENPNALILAEHYGNPDRWLRGDQWDTIMNYDAFMDPVSYFLTGLEKHSDEYNGYLHGNGPVFFMTMAEKMARLPVQSLQTAMNELSNHDHSRWMTRTNCHIGRLASAGSQAASEGISYAVFREGVVMQFTLPGSPTLYYGDETGVCGWTDPDSRRTYPWGHEDWMLIAFHKDLIRIHRKYSCFRTGSYIPLMSDGGFIAYARFQKTETAVVLINHTPYEKSVEVPVWLAELPEEGSLNRVMQTYDSGYNVGVLKEKYEKGMLKVTVPAFSSTIYVSR